MKIALDTTSTTVDATPSDGARAHTGRTSGFLTAFGALAALVGSACSGGSETNPSTTTERPTTTVDTTTPVTTIDSTTTIAVETTTTVDAPSEITLDISSVNAKVSALFLLLSGHTPTTNADGSITFDLTQTPDPMRAVDTPDDLIMRIVATREVWDTRVALVTPEETGWIITNDVSPTLIADTAEQAYALADAATTENDRSLIRGWGEYMATVPGTLQIVEICAQVSNDPDKVEYAKPILVETATGRVAWESIYTEELADGAVKLGQTSPFSGLSCEDVVDNL